MREVTSRSGSTGLSLVGRGAGALLLVSALAAVGAAGCFGDVSSSSSSGGGFGYAPVSGDDGGSGGSSSGATSPQPLLAVVDTGQTLSAPAGQGVGVFIEYQTGGHWHLAWTCDTELTGRDCPFVIAVSVASSGTGPAVDGGADIGTIANVAGE